MEIRPSEAQLESGWILKPEPDEDDVEHYVVEIQGPDNNWRVYATCNCLDAASTIVRRLADILGTARVVDVIHDRMILFERFYTPPPDDDQWWEEDDFEPHDWKEEGF